MSAKLHKSMEEELIARVSPIMYIYKNQGG